MSESLAEYAGNVLHVYDPSMLQVCATMGPHDGSVWHTAAPQFRFMEHDVSLHLFEKSVELLKHKAAREYYDPLQVRR